METSTSRAVYIVLLCISFVYLVRSCPTGPEVTCCACVSHQGCSWYRSRGFCSDSPYLQGWAVPPELADGTDALPNYPSLVTVTHNQPFHLGRSRLVMPQRARVSLALGARHQFSFRVTSRESRTRLQVRGPANNTGGVEFSLRRADSDSCVDGLREVIRRSGSRRNHGGARRAVRNRTAALRSRRRNRRTTDPRGQLFPRRRKYNCRGGGQGLVHSLYLNLDVKRCLERPVQIKVVIRDGSRSSRLRIRLDSQCGCPVCTENATAREGDRSGEGRPQNSDAASTSSSMRRTVVSNCTNQTDSRHCGTVQLSDRQLNPQAVLCQRRGVNDICEANEFGPSCSGRGGCLCGNCLCGATSPGSYQRFTGVQCECDDYSCNRSQGALCGGARRGRCQCGRCECYPGYEGDACESSSSQDRCRNFQGANSDPGVDPPPVCSGRGTCIDGLCECPWPYTGSYCECDNAACPRHQGQLCGGSRGQCVCGHCLCAPGYAGDACDVESGRLSYEAEGWGGGPPESCLSPVVDGVAGEGGPEGWGLVCSGRGVCLRGRCHCPSPYSGTLCQD